MPDVGKNYTNPYFLKILCPLIFAYKDYTDEWTIFGHGILPLFVRNWLSRNNIERKTNSVHCFLDVRD